jgi:hypothetical protein
MKLLDEVLAAYGGLERWEELHHQDSPQRRRRCCTSTPTDFAAQGL